jgi:sec-independent protein translocase protein TatB
VFDIGLPEFAVIAVIAILVIGPDKLPGFARDAANLLRQVRRMAHSARADVARELGPEFQDISMRDLDARRLATRHLLGEDPLYGNGRGGGGRAGTSRPAGGAAGGSAPNQAAASEPAPFDPDAT